MAPTETAKKRKPSIAILSGGIAGGIEICITYPTEFVKTQLQLQQKMMTAAGTEAAMFTGTVDCVKKTIQTRGVPGLYRGLSALLYFSVPKSAVRFMAFEYMKNNFQDSQGKLSRPKTLFCGLFAGVCEAVTVVTPMETIKVKFIHDQCSARPQYRGFFHGVSSIVKQQGFKGTYAGLFPTILKQGSNQAIRFFVYGELTRYFRGGDPDKKLTTFHTLFCGAIAGAASVFGNTPIDVVKTRMQGLEANKYSSSWDCVKHIAKNEGPLAFYKGTVPRLGRVCADVAIVFTLYEKITTILERILKDKDE